MTTATMVGGGLKEIVGDKKFVAAVKLAGRRAIDGIFKKGRVWLATQAAQDRVRIAYDLNPRPKSMIARLKMWKQLEGVEAIGESGLIMRDGRLVSSSDQLGIEITVARRLFPELIQDHAKVSQKQSEPPILAPPLFSAEEIAMTSKRELIF